MRCRRSPIEAEVVEYKTGEGLEDGTELFSDVVTKGWIVTERLVKITKDNGAVVCPYITHRRGRTFIEEGDYIIIADD